MASVIAQVVPFINRPTICHATIVRHRDDGMIVENGCGSLTVAASLEGLPMMQVGDTVEILHDRQYAVVFAHALAKDLCRIWRGPDNYYIQFNARYICFRSPAIDIFFMKGGEIHLEQKSSARTPKAQAMIRLLGMVWEDNPSP